MDAPTGHEQNADQVAYWNGPAGQRWARAAGGAGRAAQAGRRPRDRSGEAEAGRARHRCRLRQRRHGDRVRARGRAVRPCARRRHIRPDAGAGAAECAEGPFDRFRAGGRDRLSVRARQFRCAGLAVRRDVLRRSRAVVCQHAQGAAALGPAGLRLLARAARKPVLHGAAAGRLQARAKTAAAGAGRSRAVCVCLGGARPPRFSMRPALPASRWSRVRCCWIPRSAEASMARCRARSKSARSAARWMASRKNSARPPRLPFAKR